MSNLNRRSFFLAAAAAAVGTGDASGAQDNPREEAGSAAWQLGTGKQSPFVRNVRGKILYVGEDDQERGREWFSFSFREDGQITLRAYCEIDDARVQRDVVYTMTEDFRPLDCFVRLHSQGKFLGTGWVLVGDEEAECEVFNSALGRLAQRVPLAMPPGSLGAHPLANDALVLPSYDHSKTERVQTIEGRLSTSELLDGASGPLLSVRSLDVEYVGPERVTTPVGTFEAHHYRFPPMPDRPIHPSGTPLSQDVWVTHPDYTFVRAEVRGYLRNRTGFGRYELVEFEG